MQTWTFIRKLSQPLKSLYVLFLLSFVGAIVTVVAGGPDTVALAGVGAISVATGLTMLTNLNRAADTAAEAMKTYRPGGVDYSKSWMATPLYARIFGAAFAAIGGAFLYAGLTQG